MEEKGQRQTMLFKIVFMTKCYLLLFFLQKPYYKLQLAFNYWKTCIPKRKEGGMNSIVFNPASFHNDLNNIQFLHFFKVVKITINVHRNPDKHRNQTFSMSQCKCTVPMLT